MAEVVAVAVVTVLRGVDKGGVGFGVGVGGSEALCWWRLQ